jgi:hypothetical protein
VVSEGTEWQLYTSISALASADTLLALQVSDHGASTAGTVHQVTAANAARAFAALSASVIIVQPSGDTSGAADWAAVQAALLSFGTLGSWSGGEGGIVLLAPGLFYISKTLIIPSGITLQGSGWATEIILVTNSGCDMIQFATNDSSSQATVLGVSASAIANAFYAKICDLALHGDAFSATTPAYFHGINITTFPVSTAAGGDPGFDPLPTIENVWIKACTGDGYYHENGRSGAFLKRVLVESCNGNAYSTGTDTTLVDCLAAFCGGGFYQNHSANVGTGCKAYNTYDWTWVSGASYVATELAVSGGVMYWCTSAVSGTTAPASDPTHWTVLSAATAPQATGYGYYWDENASEQCWSAVDAQDNSKGGYYFHGPLAGAINVFATSATDNFDNSQPAYNSANPNHNACVTFDGCSGVNMQLSSSKQTGNSVVICTLLNSPGSNTLIATTDGTEAAVFNGGTPTFALVNGIIQSSLSLDGNKVTSLANGTASTDGAAYGQTPAGGNTVTVAQGGTGQVTAGAAYNALSPMTTLGDSAYGGTSGAGTRLAGNTTATKKFLTQTGTGSVSAAPGWNAIAAGDVPSTLNATAFSANLTGQAGLLLTALASKTSAYTVNAATDFLIEGNAAGGSFNITLPDATTCAGQLFIVKQTDTSANTVAVLPHSGQTIDGNAAWDLGAYAALVVISDGTEFRAVLAYGATQNNQLDDGAGNMIVTGTLDLASAGKGLKVKEGSNAKQGTLTLNGTTAVVVSNNSVTANSRIFLTTQSPAGSGPGSPYVSARTAATSFSVKSTVASDTSTVAYFITEPG